MCVDCRMLSLYAIAFFLLYPLSRFKISIGYFICLLAFAFLLSVFAGKFVLLQLIEKYYSIMKERWRVKEDIVCFCYCWQLLLEVYWFVSIIILQTGGLMCFVKC